MSFFKVFRVYDGKKVSINREMVVNYDQGKRSVPCEGTNWIKGFRTLMAASNWAASESSLQKYEIWECEGEEIRNTPTHIGWGQYDSYWETVRTSGTAPVHGCVTVVDEFYEMVFVATCRPIRKEQKLPCTWVR